MLREPNSPVHNTSGFQADVWQIVDVCERPDLYERIRNLALHDIACPRCGQVASVEVPLLAFRPSQTPPLIFVPGADASAQQIQQKADQLLALLKQRLGPA